jgi:hypothetical protein
MDQYRNDTDVSGEASEATMTTLAAIGDRELWYAEGGEVDENNEPAWRFPIYVDWKQSTADGKKYASLYPAVCPHYKASLILKELFQLHDRIEKENHWLIPAGMVEALLKKAPGITPERYYRWNGKQETAMRFTKETMPGNEQPKFLRVGPYDRRVVSEVAKESGLQSSVVKIVLDGLSKAAARLLIQEHAPIDLGFVKLVAVPFRANWKEIVCFKLRKLGLLKQLKEEIDEQAGARSTCADTDNLGLPEIFSSPHNVAICRVKTKKGCWPLSRVDYSIEAIPSAAFEKQVGEIETRHRSAGHTSYVARYEQTVEKLYENILEILQAYRKKIGLPFARICESRASGGLRFVATLGIKARAHGHNLRDLPLHIVPPARGFSAIAEQSEPELVRAPLIEMPKVPAFSQAVDDLRQRIERRGMEELGNGEGGAGWVSLCDVDKIEAAGKSMLPCPETGRESPWVEIIGD